MARHCFQYSLLLLLSTVALFSCNRKAASSAQERITTNTPVAQKAPYLLLISLDGFRWDYVEKFSPPHLSAFIGEGVQAESLIPAFPSKTFPNHYTIATGMYPDKHGLVGNSFYSYEKKQLYKIGNRKVVEDGTFYRGTPIWVKAHEHDMVSASYFFVGSEADVQGKRPTYYYRYDGAVKNETRVAQAIEWLKLPARKRPHLITMYFSDLDDVGHDYGPGKEEEIRKVLLELDQRLGDLFEGVSATGLPVNIIIVSDHGMANQSVAQLLPVEDIRNDSLFMTVNNGAIVNIHPHEGVSIDRVLQYLKSRQHHFKVYRTEDTPEFEYRPQNKDWGAIQVIPDIGYYFSGKKGIAAHREAGTTVIGVHGYTPTMRDMHGIFYAKGPAFKSGYTIPSLANVHLYPLMCELLGLDIPADIDGALEEIKSVLREE